VWPLLARRVGSGVSHHAADLFRLHGACSVRSRLRGRPSPRTRPL